MSPTANRTSPPIAREPTPDRSVWARAKSLLELSAAAGVLMFTALSVMYAQFYGPLGLEADDVGLTQTVIVQRALAGVLVVAGSGVLGLAILLAIRSSIYLVEVAGEWLAKKLLSVDHQKRLQQFRERRLVRWIATFYFVPGISVTPDAPWAHRRQLSAFGALFVAGALVLTFANGWRMVNDHAGRATRGESVYPLTFAGIRVLDIESRLCHVTWLGDADQRPYELSDPALHCLGSADGTAFFRTANTTLRVPSNLITISVP